MLDKRATRTILLIDVMGEARRAFSIIPEITDHEGRSINALIGFHNFMQRILQDIPCDGCVAAWSGAGATFRHRIFPEYKSHRSLPESLANQKELITRYLTCVGVPQYASSGFEADDILATLSTKLWQHGYSIVIDTIDKDLCSLVSDRVRIWNFRTKSLWGVQEVVQKFGVAPNALPDLLALVGDSTDGIPGVPQVGPKKAVQLLERFGDTAQLLSRTSELSEKDRVRIQAARELILRNLQLTRLIKDVNLDFEPVLIPKGDISTLQARLSDAGELLKKKDTSFLFGAPFSQQTGAVGQRLLW